MTGQRLRNLDESARRNLSDQHDQGPGLGVQSGDVIRCSAIGRATTSVRSGALRHVGRRCGARPQVEFPTGRSARSERVGAAAGKDHDRGFVRNYARLVGLDAQALMSELEVSALPGSPELRGTVGTPVSMAEGKSDRRDVIRVLAGVIVLALAILVLLCYARVLAVGCASVQGRVAESDRS